MDNSPVSAETRSVNARRAPKSRNGCLRCKAKRLKCDEGKPECHRCSRKQLSCPGYRVKSLVWSTKHEKVVSANSTAPLPDSNLLIELTQSISGDYASISDEHANASHGEKKPIDPITSTPKSPMTTIPNASSTSPHRESSPAADSLASIRQQLQRSTVPEFLLHLPTMLVEYYFSYVCRIFSSFDGNLNPFRSTVGKLWDGSAPIYYAIQSMAAAYLANHIPRMSPVGVQMQRETYKCLYNVQQGGADPSENLDKILLTVLLVGQTTAWHDPKDLGLVHLRTAKVLNRKRIEGQGSDVDARALRQNEFFEQCILYWDMLAGFVDDNIDESEDADIAAEPAISSPVMNFGTQQKVFPHPWTGIAPQIQSLFLQVGRLIRHQRKLQSQDKLSLDFLSFDNLDIPQDSTAALEGTMKAHSLEEQLLAFTPPSISNLIDAGDENTPVQQYIYLAESYRCAALLEIYRVFPQLLFNRVPTSNHPLAANDEQVSNILSIPTSQSPDDFLVSLAIHTLSLLEKLPVNSGTRCLQPILFLTTASELRFAPASTFSFESLTTGSIFTGLTTREVDVASARRFVTTRLQEFQLSLPAKPIVRALRIVEETWARADLGQEVYWMDVMEEMGLGTIFG